MTEAVLLVGFLGVGTVLGVTLRIAQLALRGRA